MLTDEKTAVATDGAGEPTHLPTKTELDASQATALQKDTASSTDDGKAEDAQDDEPKGGLKDYFRIFAYCDRLDAFLYTIAIVSAIAVGATLPLMTLVFGNFTAYFNDFSAGTSTPVTFRNQVDDAVLYFIWLFIARLGLSYISNLAISIAAARTTRGIRKDFLDRTIRKEVWHFDKATVGSAATQLTTNGNLINQGIAEKLASFVQGVSLFFSAFILAIAVQWKLALIVSSIVPALVLIFVVCIGIDTVVEAKMLRIYSQGAVQAQDAIGSIRTIHAFGAQDKIVARYDEYLGKARKVGAKKSPIYGILFASENFLVLSGTALAFWQGYRMFSSGEIADVGTVFTVVLSVTIGTTAFSIIAPNQQALVNAASAASELFTIIDQPSLLDPLAPGGLEPSSCTGQIEIKDISFAYPSRPQAKVLQGLTLSVPAGKTTAIVGPSGCGKSTLIGLLERWYLPASGSLSLDGHDTSDYNVAWLRSTMRLVQQEPVLFRGTVFENVAKGLVNEQRHLPLDKQRELVAHACQQSNAHDFVTALPQGYDTQVGERASMLSGGQRQRIAIARSIISNPQILLLDEATSALDPTAEQVVQAALNKVSKNKTTLVIAHKLATVKAADNIAVIQAGRVVEQGTHKALVDLGGLYASMVRAQDLNTSDQDHDSDVNDDSPEHDQLAPTISLQRTRTEAASIGADNTVKHLSSGTLNYSLLRCIYIMFAENKDLYWCYFISFIGTLIGGGTYSAQAIIFSRLINVFVIPDSDEAQSQTNLFALMFFVLALANFAAYFAIGWLCNIIGQTVTHRYRREMLERILSFDQDFHDLPENSSGALTSKLSSVPTSLQELISINAMLMVIVVVNIVASSIVGIAFGWKLGLVVAFGGLPILVGCGAIRIRLDQKLEKDTNTRFADSAGLATEAVTSIRTISSLTMESQLTDEFNAAMDEIVGRACRSFVWTLVPYAFSQSLDFLVLALGFWYGSRLISTGEYTVTQFFVVFIAIVFGGQAAAQFFGYSTSITKAGSAANYILWLRTVKPQIGEDDSNRDIGPSGDGSIQFHDVDFRYIQRSAARVLKDVNITIEPGTYAAFVGASGCGKSTLIALLQRFYDPSSGKVTLNGDDISKMSPRLYRDHMSLVQQEPPLYQGSVRDNICLGLTRPATDDEITVACTESNAQEFIQSLPDGLNTDCGSKGSQFSGGQKQRIAVARALIRKPRLLLLDEATSALDTTSERVVQAALDAAAAGSGRTTVAVAHRLSTIKGASVIFVVDAGRVVEVKTHEELVHGRGRYYAMCLAQSLDQ